MAQQLYRDIANSDTDCEKPAWQRLAGYGEIHFPSTTTEAVRITFLNRYIGLDELEIFGIGDLERNVASTESGATVTTAPGMEVLRNELWKVNDGEYGTERWAARVPRKKENPWLEFRFQQQLKSIASASVITEKTFVGLSHRLKTFQLPQISH